MDFVNDNSKRTWIKIASLITLPQYVKESLVMTKEAATELDKTDFADPNDRLFPINDAASIWTSSIYFDINKDKLNKNAQVYTEAALKNAQAVYGVADDVTNALKEFNSHIEKTAANDEDYCWLIKNAGGTVIEKRYKVCNKEDIVKAAEYFIKYRDNYTADNKKDICRGIVKKAAQLEVELDSIAQPVLSDLQIGLPNITVIETELYKRASYCTDDKATSLINSLISVLSNSSIKEITEKSTKLAEALDNFDAMYEMDTLYDKKLMRPADIFFGVSIKEAEKKLAKAFKLSANVFDIQELCKLAVDNYAILGDDFIKDFSNPIDPVFLRTKLSKLADDDKYILEEHLLGL